MIGRLDTVVVGGGPAGLTAALYLARYRRPVLVLDAGGGRCSWIPRSHNLPGFPDGLPGPELLLRLRREAERYGAVLRRTRAAKLARRGIGGFVVTEPDGTAWQAASVLLATGVRDVEPDLPDLYGTVGRGLVRYCPICDAWEAIDKRIGVLGRGAHGVREALFLRHYSPDVTLLTLGDPLTPEQRDRLADAGIAWEERGLARLLEEEGRIAAIFDAPADGLPSPATETHMVFDTLYAAMGSLPHNELAAQLGLSLADDGRVPTDSHQRTAIPGLYAAGDIVPGLNQIAVAVGQGVVAATAIHNDRRAAETGGEAPPAFRKTG